MGLPKKSSRIKNRVREAPAGKAGDVFTVRYSFKGVDVPNKRAFKVFLKVRGNTGGKTFKCKSGRSGTFSYVDMDCSVTIDRDFSIVEIFFDYKAKVGTVYLDSVSMEYTAA